MDIGVRGVRGAVTIRSALQSRRNVKHGDENDEIDGVLFVLIFVLAAQQRWKDCFAATIWRRRSRDSVALVVVDLLVAAQSRYTRRRTRWPRA